MAPWGRGTRAGAPIPWPAGALTRGPVRASSPCPPGPSQSFLARADRGGLSRPAGPCTGQFEAWCAGEGSQGWRPPPWACRGPVRASLPRKAGEAFPVLHLPVPGTFRHSAPGKGGQGIPTLAGRGPVRASYHRKAGDALPVLWVLDSKSEGGQGKGAQGRGSHPRPAGALTCGPVSTS